MLLYIDTTKEETILQLHKGDVILAEKKWLAEQNQSEELLQEIDKLLKQNKAGKKDLTGILVNAGPGRYTGQRVGVTTANFLGFSLNLQVSTGIIHSASRRIEFIIPVTPAYAHPPVITKSKK